MLWLACIGSGILADPGRSISLPQCAKSHLLRFEPNPDEVGKFIVIALTSSC